MWKRAAVALTAFAVLFSRAVVPAHGQDLRPWTDSLERTYRVIPNITYQTASNWDAKLDLSHSTRLHEALKQSGVPEQLVTIAGAGHGGFNREQNIRAFAELRAFLVKHGVVTAHGSH